MPISRVLAGGQGPCKGTHGICQITQGPYNAPYNPYLDTPCIRKPQRRAETKASQVTTSCKRQSMSAAVSDGIGYLYLSVDLLSVAALSIYNNEVDSTRAAELFNRCWQGKAWRAIQPSQDKYTVHSNKQQGWASSRVACLWRHLRCPLWRHLCSDQIILHPGVG